METELRELIGKYGLKAVHKGLEKEMKDTFSYLSGLYGTEKKAVKKNIIVEEAVEPECIIDEFDEEELR